MLVRKHLEHENRRLDEQLGRRGYSAFIPDAPSVVVFAQYTLIAVRPIARQLVSATKLYVSNTAMSRQTKSGISRDIAARRCGQSRHFNAPNFDALIGQRRHECHELMTHARVDGFSVKKMMILLLRVPRIGTP